MPPMTPAERQRKYRERLKQNNPEKYEEMRLKNIKRIKAKYVKISKLSESQKNIRRKNWRRLKKDQKKRCEETEEKTKSKKIYQRNYYKLKKNIERQNRIIKKQKKVIEKLRKRLYRQKILFECQKLQNDNEEHHSENENLQEGDTQLTPISKTNSFLESMPSISIQDKQKIRKVIFEHNILSGSIKNLYENAKCNTVKNVLKKIVKSEITCRYKVCNRLGRYLGLKGKIRSNRNKTKTKLSKRAKQIRKFFLQDNVSRATAGKNETKTFKKVKKQKRYLLDTLVNLHQKFIRDTGINIGYTTFIRNKPFYVLRPRISDRYTCICKIHANMEFKFIAVKKLGILNSYHRLNNLVDAIVCNKESEICMSSQCHKCKEKKYCDLTKIEEDKNVSWIEWIVKEIEYTKNEVTKKSKRAMTETKSDILKNFLTIVDSELQKYKIHLFNIGHQYTTYTRLKNSLKDNEILIHCDFSENYNCKMHEEIQAVHFGASQYQITLHTCVVYKKNHKPKSYCTLSDCNNHSPEAIWAHLSPVLIDIKKRYPQVNYLHIYSDGPTTQYKQKKNFYLLKKYIDEFGFEAATWNFSESYHGKGPADGVGATIKRSLDQKVSHGCDVLDASKAYALLNAKTNVTLFCVSEGDINDIKINNERALNSLTAVPQTLKIHQVLVTNEDNNDMFYRKLSCFCEFSTEKEFCACFDLKKHNLLKPILPKKRPRQIYTSSDSDEDTSRFILPYAYFPTSKSVTTSISTTKENISKLGSSLTTPTCSPTRPYRFFADVEDSLEPIYHSETTPMSTGFVTSTSTLILNNDNFTNINKSKEQTNTKPHCIPKKVTILSDVKINNSDDLQKILQSSSRYNKSSYKISGDFPELVINSPHKKVIRDLTPEMRPSTSKLTASKHALNFFDLSSDEEQ